MKVGFVGQVNEKNLRSFFDKTVESTTSENETKQEIDMKLSDLLQSVTQNTASIDGVRWYPVRPMTAENTFLLPRAKAAWRVLAGKSDAIEWDYPTKSEPNV
jgi:hypothetical protein